MRSGARRTASIVFVIVGFAGCGGGGTETAPTGPSPRGADVEVDEVVRAFVEEVVADLEFEASAVWSRRNTFDVFGSALALLGSDAVFDGTAFDPPGNTLETAPTRCRDRFGHRLWRQLNRCSKIARDLTTYTALLFIAESPRDEVDARHVLSYASDDGEATIVYRENPVSRWDVVDRPDMTATTSVSRDVRVEVAGETFDLRHSGTIEIDEPGAGAVTLELRFPSPRLTVELQVSFVGGFEAAGTITRGTRTVATIGGMSGGLTFDW